MFTRFTRLLNIHSWGIWTGNWKPIRLWFNSSILCIHNIDLRKSNIFNTEISALKQRCVVLKLMISRFRTHNQYDRAESQQTLRSNELTRAFRKTLYPLQQTPARLVKIKLGATYNWLGIVTKRGAVGVSGEKLSILSEVGWNWFCVK